MFLFVLEICVDIIDRFLRRFFPAAGVGREDRMADNRRAEQFVDEWLAPSCAANYMNEVAKATILRMAHGVVAHTKVDHRGKLSKGAITIEGAVCFVIGELTYVAYEPTGVAELLFEIQRCDVHWDQYPLQFLRWITVEAGNVRAELAKREEVSDLRDPEVPRMLVARIQCGYVLQLFASPEPSSS